MNFFYAALFIVIAVGITAMRGGFSNITAGGHVFAGSEYFAVSAAALAFGIFLYRRSHLILKSDSIEYNDGRIAYESLEALYIKSVFPWSDTYQQVYGRYVSAEGPRVELGAYKKEIAQEIVWEFNKRKISYPTSASVLTQNKSQELIFHKKMILVVICIVMLFWIVPAGVSRLLRLFGTSLDMQFNLFASIFSAGPFVIFGWLMTRDTDPWRVRIPHIIIWVCFLETLLQIFFYFLLLLSPHK